MVGLWAGRSRATYCIPATKQPAIAKQTMKSTSRASGDRVDCDNDMGDTILFEYAGVSC